MNTLTNSPPESRVESQFLAGITDRDREMIIGSAESRKVQAKNFILQSDTKATHLFMLSSGGARYYLLTKQGEELVLRWLIPGDVFGIATLLKHPPDYMGSVQATKDSQVYAWPHDKIRELASQYPKLAENALRITLGYLSAYAERHSSLLKKTAEQRLAQTLIQLGHRTGQVHPTGVQVDITNDHLGSLADVGPFTVSRVLGRWESRGAVTKGRGKVLIQSPEKLLAQ